MAHVSQPAVMQCHGKHTASREASTSCMRPQSSSAPSVQRQKLTVRSRAMTSSRNARSWLAPPLGLRLSNSRIAALQSDPAGQQDTARLPDTSEVAPSRGPRTEFPPFSNIQKGDVYDLRLYEVCSERARAAHMPSAGPQHCSSQSVAGC